jgi:hypothetical protein
MKPLPAPSNLNTVPDHPVGEPLGLHELAYLQQLTDPGPLERAAVSTLGPVLDRASELIDPGPLLQALGLYGVSGVGPAAEAAKKAKADKDAGGAGIAYVASPQMKALGRTLYELLGIHDAGDASDRGFQPQGGIVHVPMPGAVEKNKAPF